MSAFRFRLEPVLRYRRRRVDAQKRVVADRLRGIRVLSERMREIEAQITQSVGNIRMAMHESTLPMEEVLWTRHWLGRLRREWIETQAALREHQRELEQERRRLAERMAEAKVLERLKERQASAHAERMEHAESLSLDEFAIQQHLRRAVVEGSAA
ncbi:MAG: flagellar FliJ family protein [Phycisphaerae bacterium]|nr:flagellar FliJ family protein [Phycisphaerae bacterium]